MEMIHMMLKNPEVVTYLDFNKVSTFILEIRAGVIVYSDIETEDGVYIITALEDFWRFLDIDESTLSLNLDSMHL